MSQPEARIRALIVDDEPLARRGLELRLKRYQDIEVVGEASNGRDALTALSRLHPELMFLDVQMPDIDGFTVISEVPALQLPLVVFVTAYKEHALDAFSAEALDYLLKPVSHVRLEKALARARAQLAAQRAQSPKSLARTPYTARAPTLSVKHGSSIVRIDIDDIACIEAAGDYACIHATDEIHVIRESLNELEQLLDPKRFARVHRSTIVNLSYVKAMRPHFNGEYFLTLHSGQEVKLSRSYRDKLRLLI